LIDDLERDERWVPQKDALQQHRSAVAAPLLVGEDVVGVLLVFNRKVNFFSPEQLTLINVIASQVAVAINNANLYKLIREQAERLGNMLRSEQEEATRSQSILEAVADGVLVTDAKNQISFMNVSAEKILNIKSEKVITKTLKDFSGLFGKAANIWHEIIHEWSENPSLYEEGDTYAEQLALDDGRIVLVHLAPVVLKTKKSFLGTVSIFRDITHEVEVDRLKSEFVTTVSHELRTPMTSIRGYVDILLMGAAGALTENQIHFLDIIRDNTERLNILVTDLLDVSRIESGRITLSHQSVSLKKLANDAVASIVQRAQDEEKPMTFSLEIEPDLPPVYADADRTRQIINNLIENAYHYTPENGEVIIRIHRVKGADEIQVDVQDNGVGIGIDEQEQVFERFYRGEDALVLATPGTGLGLPIVKQLVEMHEGRIWVESLGKTGEGSTFSFTLPVYKDLE
ncbi:MAG TPA: GAF domain-containing sensor histidine kinase, partial [Anaerolineales bacterium]|nr:GAF domain-containing sensor histidine kinase [Anaerolineales bacterium]